MTVAVNAPTVLRSIGKWSLAALVLNNIIGSGVFALPGTIAARLGWWSLLALIIAAAVAGAIMLSFAEVASRFDAAGGPYLYAHTAFGRMVGLQMGWMAFFVRVLSAAVQVNLLTAYLAEFWAPVSTGPGRAFTGALFLGVLCVVNLRGVAQGTMVSNVFAVIKLVPLLLVGAGGLAWLAQGMAVPAVAGTVDSAGGWLTVLLLLMFSYGGFEASTFPLGEAKDPKRDMPFSLIVGLAAVVVVYLVVQVAVLVTLSDPGASERPLAEVARVFLGGPGAVLMSLVALISVSGWGASAMVAVPRLTYAMAERGDLPAAFRWVHPKWRTPWFSIVMYTGVTYVLSLQGGLLSNISLSTVSRLLTYGLVCAAFMVFRRWDAAGQGQVAGAGFRAPAGWLMAGIGVGASLLLVTRMSGSEGIWLLVVVAIALVHWLVIRRSPGTQSF